MRQFYASLVKAMVHDFRSRWEALAFWIALAVGFVGAVYPPLANALSLAGGSFSAFWGVALVFVVLGYSFARVNFQRFESLSNRIAEVDNRSRPAARQLSNNLLSVEPTALPISEGGLYLGHGLALRFTNHSDESMVVRCRLVKFGRELPNGEFEPEDWFQERQLRWSDGSLEERLVPGAHRDCMVVRQTLGSADATRHGSELPHTVLPGRIEAGIETEVDGFAVRRLDVNLEWRPPKPPYSPGLTLVWRGIVSDSANPSVDGVTAKAS
jgi:hypothetical protein